jgi:glycosyltransferase involved in cell wall biosynthesis
MNYPKISIITPNYNQGSFIEETILSVLNQQYPNLEYIIIDGGSTDNSIEIIKKYSNRLTYWISEKDTGMYNAINKGFAKSSGDIMGWINSDDILAKESLFNIAKLFNANKKIKWLQGFPTVINENSAIIYQRKQVYTKYFFYAKLYIKSLNFIQQESTFWKRELWEKTGNCINETYSVAGDFDLWMKFFTYEKLYCTNKQLGAFRKRAGQQSENITTYIEETKTSIQNNYEKLNRIEKIKISIGKVIYKALNIKY